MPTPGWDSAALREAHALFLELMKREKPEARRQLAYALLVHPTSQARLRCACWSVMRRSAARQDLRADVMQEATYRLAERMAEGKVPYEDRGPAKFGTWLSGVCRGACSNAWRRCRPLWLKGVSLKAHEQLDRFAAPIEEIDPYGEAPAIVLQSPNVRLRQVFLDWIADLSIRESASRQGLTKSDVDRLRHEAFELFQRAHRRCR